MSLNEPEFSLGYFLLIYLPGFYVFDLVDDGSYVPPAASICYLHVLCSRVFSRQWITVCQCVRMAEAGALATVEL
jgi:hypothetical protein